MADPMKVFLIGPDEDSIAELLIADEEEGWFTGRVISQSFSFDVRKTLAWYDEVLRDQMLSYLDEATAAVLRIGLQARFPNGSTHKTFSLHISRSNEVSFRISPVAPPPELPNETIL